MTNFSTYQTTHQRRSGRIGELRLRRGGKALPPLSTPILYPVISFMTGTSPRGGGIWKYLLRNFAKRQPPTPMLSQVLHFLDFNLTGRHIAYWREKPMRERYQEVDLSADAPLFLDSGGFKLLYNAGLDLSDYGIHKESEADDILAFQRDFGGDIIASLDYPLPPGLARDEAEVRMGQSLQNAVRVAELLADTDEAPYLYVCCHGQSREDIQSYVTRVFERLEGVLPSFGLAVGSLVPLRGGNDAQVLERIRGVMDAIPAPVRERTPIHAFGVSGGLTPILAYMGVDSFDSTSYIQSARNLGYSHPQTHRKLKIMELDTLECECRICRETSLEEMQQAFMEAKSYQRTSTGKYKSEYYATIALHNFEMEVQTLADMKAAIVADEGLEGLIRHASTARGIQDAVEWLAANDNDFGIQVTRHGINTPKRVSRRALEGDPNQLELFTYQTESHNTSLLREEPRTISLNYTPDSFTIPPDYQPPPGKRVLLTIPCAGKKPYSLSRTHTIVNTKLQTAFGENQRAIHKVTLSGLYGPVPEEFESEEPVVRYEFQLSPRNAAQIQRCAERFIAYLDTHGGSYELLVGYATSNAYRQVFELIQKRRPDFILLPTQPKQKRLSEFFRHVHLDVLVEVLSGVLGGED
jgi:7-cyano-7-deazaguanine tRNA-ribosyltransferase